jgi:hypothetical protein
MGIMGSDGYGGLWPCHQAHYLQITTVTKLQVIGWQIAQLPGAAFQL